MSILDGFLKYKKYKKTDNGYILQSEWTSAETVEFADGTTLEEERAELKKSVSDGKKLVADAITDKGVDTATDATFAKMAENIGDIKVGSGDATKPDVLAGKTFTNNDGVEYTGTMPNKGAVTASVNCGSSYTIPEGYHNGSGTVMAQTLEDALDVALPKNFLSDLKSGGINSTDGGHTATLSGTQIHGDNSTNTGCSNVFVYCKTAINFSNYNKLRIVVTLDNIYPGEAFTIWYSSGNTVNSAYDPLYALTTVADGKYDITLDVKGLTGNKYLVFNCNLGKTGADDTSGCSYTFEKIRLG